MWNIVYDYILETPTGQSIQLIGFANDLALIATAKDINKLKNTTNATFQSINERMTDKGLNIAPHKTKAIILSTRKSLPVPNFHIRGHPITVVRKTRFLGVTIDSRMTFRAHIRNTASSVRGIVASLGRIMPNVGGPSANKRRLIMSITNSRLLYGAPVWANTAKKYVTSRATILGAQGAAALRITRAYRTIPRDAALALAGTPPANLLAVEETRIREKIQTDPDLPRKKTRAVERARTIDFWCSLWRANRSSARVTKQYLPDLRRWLNRPKNIETTFHLTQFLTGHGCFGAYLRRIGRLPSATCPYCGYPEDSSLHTFFNCHIWNENRAPIVELLGQPLAPEMVQIILCGPPNIPTSPHFNINWPPVVGTPTLYAKFLSMIEGILITKEADEREVQG